MKRNSDGHVYRALTVAGSDSGGGAGIQADLKTFAAFDVYGMSVIAGLTAQNTVGVQGIEPVSPEFVALQLRSVFTDLRPDAIKTGMLGNSDVIEVVADSFRKQAFTKIVVDPVMVAKGGESLLQRDAVRTLCEKLLPLALVVTPNIPEAEVLCGYTIDSFAACQKAARDIAAMGPKYVVIKGGHASESWSTKFANGETAQATDLVYSNGEETTLSSRRIDSRKTHGTGCTFSSAIAANIAAGAAVLDAIATAKVFIQKAIESAKDFDLGEGHGPTDHSVTVEPVREVEACCHYRWTGIKFEQISVR
jgi:hydroxymethylpyrimidine/phosphomethylpyrimidine kinase